MRRPYYRKPGKYLPVNTQPSSSLKVIREHILNIMLWGAVIVGLVVIVPKLIEDISRGDWGKIIIYSAVYLLLLLLTIFKKVSFTLRATSLLLLFYLLGFSATFTNGIIGNGRIWFLGFAILSSVLLGLNSAIFALCLSLATHLAIGGLVANNIISITQIASITTAGSLLEWLKTGIVFVLAAVTIIIPISIIVRDLSGSLEKEHGLLDELGKEREELTRRSSELDRRLTQMRTAAEISRSISSVLETSSLLTKVVELVRTRFDLYYVGVFLLDDKEEYAVLKAGTGEAGQKMIIDDHKLPIGGTSMIGWTIVHRQPRIALDTDDEKIIFANPLLPKTRSEIALPLSSGNKIFGAMTVQSSKLNAFDDDDVTVLQAIADSLATALQNALLFQKEEKNLEEIRTLNNQYLSEAWERVTTKPEIRTFTYSNDQVSEPSEDMPAVNFPIVFREHMIGQVSLEISKSLSSEDQFFIEQVTNQAALAMENVRLLEETQRRANHERLVTEIVNKVRISADVDTILRSTLSELGRSMQAAEGVIYLESPEEATASRLDGSNL